MTIILVRDGHRQEDPTRAVARSRYRGQMFENIAILVFLVAMHTGTYRDSHISRYIIADKRQVHEVVIDTAVCGTRLTCACA